MGKYTVIIATHDRPALLGRAIRTVKAQAFPGLSVIVVSDDRSAETHAVAKASLSGDDLYLERAGDPGPARSRTLGLALARSDYVLFLDDDDEFAPGFLAAIDRHATGTNVLFCDFHIANDAGDRTAPPIELIPITIGPRDPCDVYVRNYIPNNCLVYPIGAVRGRTFDEALVLNEDWDFLLNVIQATPLRHIPTFGPIIHKTPGEQKHNRRGTLNNHLLPDNLRTIYKKWPAPTEELRAARQYLFASVGIPLPIEEF